MRPIQGQGLLQGRAPQQGNVLQGLGKIGADKLGNGGQIVTLHSPGTTASSGNNSAGSGKIIDLPRGGLNKTGAQQNSKLGGEITRFDARPAKPLSQIHVNQQPTGISRSNIGTPPKFRQEFGNTKCR